MPPLPRILLSGLTGFFFGLLLSVPVGPVNLTILNEGARRGFRHAALIGVGASIMEVIYCSIAFTGFASFFSAGPIQTLLEFGSFIFMLGLGIRFLLIKTLPVPTKMETKIQDKFQPTSAFMTGFVRTMANPGVLAGWVLLGAYFISQQWVEPNLRCKAACVGGVLLGTGGWFTGLSYAVSLGHKKFSEKTLLRMQQGSGIGMLLLALMNGVMIVIRLVQHKS